MKEDDRIDQWLRERMDDYRPATSDSSRHRFLASLPADKSSGIHKGWIYRLSALLVLLILMFFTVLRNDSLIETPIQPESNIVSNSKNKAANPVEPIKRNSKKIYEVITITAETSKDLPPYHRLGSIDEPDFNNGTETKVSDTIIQNGPADASTITDYEESEMEDSLSDTLVSLIIDVTGNDSVEEDDEVKTPDHGSQNRYIGLYYKPGLMWNIIENEKLTHSFGLEWQSRFFNGNYILGTGIGLLRTTGYYEYAVDYNEFLGNYQRLDSISFLWNSREFSMQQTYYTTEQSVHDTAVKTGYHKLNRDFVYLQVPIVMGYDVVKNEKYSIGIRFSPILSILMSKKPIDFQYEAGLDKVIQINRITPDRVRTNWQLNTGLNFSRRISENLQIEIEPGFTYYFNSVYEKPKVSSRPYGAFVRIAIGIVY